MVLFNDVNFYVHGNGVNTKKHRNEKMTLLSASVLSVQDPSTTTSASLHHHQQTTTFKTRRPRALKTVCAYPPHTHRLFSQKPPKHFSARRLAKGPSLSVALETYRDTRAYFFFWFSVL